MTPPMFHNSHYATFCIAGYINFPSATYAALRRPRFGSLLLRLWPMMAAIVAATVLGSSFIASNNTVLTTAALGGALALYLLNRFTLCLELP
ncbi:hypothetical protein RHEC894_PD00322 (plasmid) [Rhizobium sp. CIAT894]|nr:hypothetical protein RHEC894_PD00322 [Rhizobium sp. CIAT894]